LDEEKALSQAPAESFHEAVTELRSAINARPSDHQIKSHRKIEKGIRTAGDAVGFHGGKKVLGLQLNT
jgi:hypothetical protein